MYISVINVRLIMNSDQEK